MFDSHEISPNSTPMERRPSASDPGSLTIKFRSAEQIIREREEAALAAGDAGVAEAGRGGASSSMMSTTASSCALHPADKMPAFLEALPAPE
ncbi:hypothetical protein IAT38_006557 [Cryptococcus sp. DSM 104549]